VRASPHFTLKACPLQPLSKISDKVVDLILIIIDRYIKMNIYILTTKTYNSVELTSLLIDVVVYRYGVPQGIISDRGSLFIS
jgi:hypothetical protein